MTPERLNILWVSQMPASPPRFGAQARMHGLMTELARRHDLTAVMLVDDEFDIEECRRAMQAYCREVDADPQPLWPRRPRQAAAAAPIAVVDAQLRAVAGHGAGDATRLDRVLRARRFDIVNLEFPYLGH